MQTFRKNYYQAMVEFSGQERIAEIHFFIRELPIEFFQDHGLTDQQLLSKLHVIRFWSNQAYDAVKDPETNIHRTEDERGRKNWGFVTRRMLKMVNSALGSLSQIIPAAGALKELKDVGENSMDIVKEGRRQNKDIDE